MYYCIQDDVRSLKIRMLFFPKWKTKLNKNEMRLVINDILVSSDKKGPNWQILQLLLLMLPFNSLNQIPSNFIAPWPTNHSLYIHASSINTHHQKFIILFLWSLNTHNTHIITITIYITHIPNSFIYLLYYWCND